MFRINLLARRECAAETPSPLTTAVKVAMLACAIAAPVAGEPWEPGQSSESCEHGALPSGDTALSFEGHTSEACADSVQPAPLERLSRLRAKLGKDSASGTLSALGHTLRGPPASRA